MLLSCWNRTCMQERAQKRGEWAYHRPVGTVESKNGRSRCRVWLQFSETVDKYCSPGRCQTSPQHAVAPKMPCSPSAKATSLTETRSGRASQAYSGDLCLYQYVRLARLTLSIRQWRTDLAELQARRDESGFATADVLEGP